MSSIRRARKDKLTDKDPRIFASHVSHSSQQELFTQSNTLCPPPSDGDSEHVPLVVAAVPHSESGSWAGGQFFDRLLLRLFVALIAAAVWALGVAVPEARAQRPFTDADWIALGGYAGVNGTVYASVANTNSGLIYLGGIFTVAGRTSATNIVAWDGTHWLPLGLGVNGYVSSAVVDASGNLYAAGNFTSAGGVPANYVAKWDGSRWSALGSGLNSLVECLALDASGNVYVGGYFTTAGGQPALRIAKWDGNAWSAVGNGVDNPVYGLVFDAAGNLYVGGAFYTVAGGTVANSIAKWDGNTWSVLGSGMNNYVYCVATDGSGNLYAGGVFSQAGGVPANYVARWDGANWSAMQLGFNSYVQSLVLDGQGNIYAGGRFTQTGARAAGYAAKWDGANWQTMGSGANNIVFNVTSDAAGNIYASGNFSAAGGVFANGFAKWNGTNWSALDSHAVSLIGTASAITSDESGNVYAGSIASIYPTNQTVYSGKWDGNQWAALLDLNAMASGGGFPHLKTMAPAGPGTWYLGGSFTNINGAVAQNVVRVSGTNLSALGSGCEGPIYSLATDRTGNLYAGGSFSFAGNAQANNVARWDGTNWSALGQGLNGTIMALTVDGLGNLYAGALTNGGILAVFKWDGSNWTAAAPGVGVSTNYSQNVSLAADLQGNLYLAAYFSGTNIPPKNYLARWDGTNWTSLGSGLNGLATVVYLDNNGHLFVGGTFTTAGTNFAYGFAEAIIGVATNPPVLAITNAGAGNLALSWPLDHTGWRLQSQRNPPGTGITTNWFTIPGSTNVNATNFPVNLGAGAVFYRLVYP